MDFKNELQTKGLIIAKANLYYFERKEILSLFNHRILRFNNSEIFFIKCVVDVWLADNEVRYAGYQKRHAAKCYIQFLSRLYMC